MRKSAEGERRRRGKGVKRGKKRRGGEKRLKNEETIEIRGDESKKRKR